LNSVCAPLVALILQASISSSAISAEIKGVATNNGRILILVTGDIVPGDAETFTTIVKQSNSAGKLVVNIRLNSPGGNLLEGVKLADAVRFGKIATNVGKNATCASACFLIFAAGPTKYASYGAQIGVHGASDQSGSETVSSDAATISMAKVAKELGVPATIIGRMVVTPPSEMVWLTPQDLQSMGVTMVGKPAQTLSENPTSAGESERPARQTPQQTNPSGQPLALAPPVHSSGPPTWEAMTDSAFELSKKQNGGTPRTLRSCQPSIGVCTTGVMFNLKGDDMVLMSRQNIDGKTIEREICTYNNFGDMRSCFNWDTKATHRDMKDNKGVWSEVSQ